MSIKENHKKCLNVNISWILYSLMTMEDHKTWLCGGGRGVNLYTQPDRKNSNFWRLSLKIIYIWKGGGDCLDLEAVANREELVGFVGGMQSDCSAARNYLITHHNSAQLYKAVQSLTNT